MFSGVPVLCCLVYLLAVGLIVLCGIVLLIAIDFCGCFG